MTAHPIRARTGLAMVCSTRKADRAIDLALLVVRVALAWIFIVYGAQKLFGTFNGGGIDGTAKFMANGAGLHPGRFFAYLSGIIEFGGAIALVLGLGTRIAGLALFGDMVIAMITTTWSTGLHQSTPPGYELNVALAALGLAVALLGAGRYSLDALAERRLVATGQGSDS
jgi:putative oxidoreductase